MPEEPTPFTTKSQIEDESKQTSIIGHFLKLAGFLLFAVIVFAAGLYWYVTTQNQPPENFPVGIPVIIEKGTEVRAITEILEKENIVRSDTLLYYILVLFYEPTSLKASSYIFEKPLTTFEIAERLTKGDFDTNLLRFTHFEGERATLVAKRASETLPNFDTEAFIRYAIPLEGKLFPDTYFIPDTYTDEDLLELMLSTFEEKISDLEEQIAASELTLDEILTLASIIEREANTVESKKLVSGILQNRLETGMPLQADASIEYVLNKPLSELTPKDLEIESSYNTYLYKGLPPTPIGNPGLDAIEAVLEPTKSDYFYYITGNDGEFYYAETYQRHLINIEKHLR